MLYYSHIYTFIKYYLQSVKISYAINFVKARIWTKPPENWAAGASNEHQEHLSKTGKICFRCSALATLYAQVVKKIWTFIQVMKVTQSITVWLVDEKKREMIRCKLK